MEGSRVIVEINSGGVQSTQEVKLQIMINATLKLLDCKCGIIVAGKKVRTPTEI